MERAVSVSVMRESDAEAIRNGTTGFELMRRAGEGVFSAVDWHGRIGIVCGSGNNGGDGYVLASILKEKGYACHLILMENRFSADGEKCFNLAKSKCIPYETYSDSMDLSQYDILVDCILGTGFRGEPKGIYADAIEKINSTDAYVVSVDINSGLNGDNGQTQRCVSSDLTVSIGTCKTGLLLGQAKDKIKSLVNIDIGIPIVGKSYSVPSDVDFQRLFKPRTHASHKGTYGYVTIFGGCLPYSGAVKLANLSCAAMRSGAGVCCLAVPQEIAPSVAPYLLETTLATVPSKGGFMCYDPMTLETLLSRSNAMVIGVGWGSGRDNGKILTHILTHAKIPLLLDADGLNTLARMDLSLLQRAKGPIVLTPHLKEFARISHLSMQEIMEDPIGIAETFASKYGVILLLKGATTVVTDGEETYLVTRGCPGMATAGSGDVLSGVLVALLGSEAPTVYTIAGGAYIAGLAGEMAEKEKNPVSMCASDTVAMLPMAISKILKNN